MKRRLGALLATALAWSAAGPLARVSPGAAAAAAASGDSAKAPAADTARAAPAHPANPHAGIGVPPPRGGKSGAAGKPFKVVVPPGTPRVRTVTLGIRHRVFHDFAESDEVPMRKPFTIGDTPYSATVTDFLPDFVIDVGARSITSRSNEPRNPAVRIVVRENGAPTDTAWAFLNMPPHFSARSLLAFKVLRIDFADRPPLLADTSALARPRPPDTSSTGKP